MSIDLSGALNAVGSLLGSNAAGAGPLATQIVQQAAIGAAASASLAALTHPDVLQKLLPIDPLGLAKGITPTGAPAVNTGIELPVLDPIKKTMNAAWMAANAGAVTPMLTAGYTPVS